MPPEIDTQSQPNTAALEEAARFQERERVNGIHTVGRKLGVAAATVDQHVASGTTLTNFRAIAIDAAAERQAPDVFTPNPAAAGDHRRQHRITRGHR